MKIEEFLNQEVRNNPARGMIGTESTWLDVCTIDLSGDGLYVGDPLHLSPMPFPIQLLRGAYRLSAKVIAYARDKRISRIRLVTGDGDAQVGSKVRDVSTDAASIGIADFQGFAHLFERNDRTTHERLKTMAYDLAHCSVGSIDPGLPV